MTPFLFLTLGLLAGPPGRLQSSSEIDFPALGRAFIDLRCGEDVEPSACDLETVLGRGFAEVHLGAFDLRYPAEALRDKGCAEDLQELVVGLLDLQGVWIRWLAGEEGAAAQADLQLLRDWASGWKLKTLRRLDPERDALDLMEFLHAPDEMRAAEERLVDFLHDRQAVGLAMRRPGRQRIVLAPTRLDFMRWIGWIGLVQPDKREEYWFPGVDQWTQFWADWTLIAALEYAPWNGFDPKFRSGKSMKSFEPTGMVEQVSLQAAMALIRSCVHRDLDHPDHAIAMNLVIEFVGQIDTIDGEGQLSMSGGRTQPYSRFVPGGNPNGGVLPKRSAQGKNALVKNQWRKGNGRDHFLAPLRKGQTDGYKAAAKQKVPRWKDKRAHFLLRSDTDKYVVTAPFLGPFADQQPYPPFEFINDYAQFYRAYKSAFWNWLRTHGDPAGPEASQERFRQVLRRFGEVENDRRAFDTLIEEAYELPLSAADGQTDSLEWRFLEYLRKGK